MESRELPFIRDMFDKIAPRYDLLNRLLSLRRDVAWRQKMVSAMHCPDHGRVLDVACGTGDVVMEIHRQKNPSTAIFGVDFSSQMLQRARMKTSRTSDSRICLLAGDALALPFADQSVHAITIAFGIRNIQNRPAALQAFHNCLVPGGMLLVLELAAPKKTPLYDTYMAYLQKLLPAIGRLFSKHSYAYTYLPDSVSRFPAPDVFSSMMTDAGFYSVTCHRLTMGIANLFTGIKAGSLP